MTQVALTNLNLTRGTVPILRNVNLTIEDGEFCVFVGPSGCGKSTLLRLIAGLDTDASGEIRIGGQDVSSVPAAKRNVAMVFQGYALYPHMTVRENMAFALKRAGRPKAEIDERVTEASRILQLDALLDRLPAKLSGGQRQRVAIGRAIVKQPKVFLFDEPLSNLDAALRVETRVEIARLHRRVGNASMLYVTHDQVEALTLADRIVLLQPVLHDGSLNSVVQVGTPMDLYHRPADLFAARFIGTPGMNLLAAQVAAIDADGLRLSLQGADPTQLWRAAVDPAGVRVGDAVTLGLRPEHVVEAGDGEGLAIRISHIEALGEHSVVFGQLPGGGQLLAKTTREDLRVDTDWRVTLPAAQMHVFRADGKALVRR
jgi:multiple sugar transport system ATP-binding protein